MMGEKLLNLRADDQLGSHDLTEIIDKLTSQLYFHGHPINRAEAREDVRLNFVVDATPPEEAAIWALYEAYRTDMKLRRPFDIVHELTERNALPPVPPLNPQMGNPPAIVSVDIGEARIGYIESTGRTDVARTNLVVTAQRDVMGRVQGSILSTSGGWVSELEDPADEAADEAAPEEGSERGGADAEG